MTPLAPTPPRPFGAFLTVERPAGTFHSNTRMAQVSGVPAPAGVGPLEYVQTADRNHWSGTQPHYMWNRTLNVTADNPANAVVTRFLDAMRTAAAVPAATDQRGNISIETFDSRFDGKTTYFDLATAPPAVLQAVAAADALIDVNKADKLETQPGMPRY